MDTANDKLGLFAIYCWRYGWNNKSLGNQYSTIQLKLASIRWYHRRHAGIELSASPHLEILMRGLKRWSAPVTKKQPITPAFLRLLYDQLDFSLPRSRLVWGSVLLAYFFLLRRSEYLRVGSSSHEYRLKTEDAFFSDEQGIPSPMKEATSVTIGLAGSKNDQYGRGAWRTMHATGDAILCPTQALRHIKGAMRELTPKNRVYLCSDLDATEVAHALQAVALSVGVPKANYSTHSIRSGGATALLNGKADGLAIKLLGRWMSTCFEEYPVLAAQATAGLAQKMI